MKITPFRECGVCHVVDIPRGVDWQHWIDGRPVHSRCMPPPAINPKLHRGIAYAAAFRGDWQSAEAHYRAHLEKVDAEDLDCLTELAIARYRMEADYDAQHILHMVDRLSRRRGSAGEIQSNRARAILGLIQLGRGDFTNGWINYKQHYGIPAQHAIDYDPLPEIPTWTGGELAGETLLIRGEQGMGDEIQWASLVDQLIARYKPQSYIVECNPKLLNLFASAFPRVVPRTVPAQERARIATRQIPIAAIGPHVIKTKSDFPRVPAWIISDPRLFGSLECFREIAYSHALRVGICWNSSRPDKDQSAYAAPAEWRPITSVPGIRFVALQTDLPHVMQKVFGGTPIEHSHKLVLPANTTLPDADLHDDVDTLASIIESSLDLVIGPPNTTTYLSAALGVETWMLSFKREWILHGESSPPWFPMMNIFTKTWQQPATEFMRAIADNLQQKTKERAPCQTTQ